MVTSAQSEQKNASEAVCETTSNGMTETGEGRCAPAVEQGQESQRGFEGEDEALPLRRVVIDDEEDDGASTPQEHLHTSGLPYEDHNYGDSRCVSSSRSNEESTESFPVIAGLASYFGEDEMEDQHSSATQRNVSVTESSPIAYRAPVRETYYRQSESGGGYSMQSFTPTSQATYRITQNPGANLVTIGGRTYVRQTASNVTQAYRSAPRESYSSPAISGGGSFSAGSYGGARRMSAGVAQLKRSVRPGGISMGHAGVRIGVMSSMSGSPSKQYASSVTAANIVADPMRAANDNAPAPFIVPARSSKPTLRARVQNGRGRGRSDQHDEPSDTQVNVYRVSPRKASNSYGNAPSVHSQQSASRMPISDTPKADYMTMEDEHVAATTPQSDTVHYHAAMEHNTQGNAVAMQANTQDEPTSHPEDGAQHPDRTPVTCQVDDTALPEADRTCDSVVDIVGEDSAGSTATADGPALAVTPPTCVTHFRRMLTPSVALVPSSPHHQRPKQSTTGTELSTQQDEPVQSATAVLGSGNKDTQQRTPPTHNVHYHSRLYDASGRLREGVEVLAEGALHGETSPRKEVVPLDKQNREMAMRAQEREDVDRYVEEFLQQRLKLTREKRHCDLELERCVQQIAGRHRQADGLAMASWQDSAQPLPPNIDQQERTQQQPCEYEQILESLQQLRRDVQPRGRGRPARIRSSHSATFGGGVVLPGNPQEQNSLARSSQSPSQSPSKSPYRPCRGAARQVPTSPGHVAGVYPHVIGGVPSPSRSRMQHSGRHKNVQQEEQKQQGQLLIPTMPPPIPIPPQTTNALIQPHLYPPEHSQLSSPEQPLSHGIQHNAEGYPLSGTSQMQSVPVEAMSYANSTVPQRVLDLHAHLGHVHGYGVNEELSSGEEFLLAHTHHAQFVTNRQTLLVGRSSTSAADEENSSFTEDMTEDKGTEDEGNERRRSNGSAEGSTESESSDGESWDEEYTTRCHCGLEHNDEFMIQCEACKVWQHVKCMGMDRKHIPKVYKCEECHPRPMKLTKTEAREMQLKVIARIRKLKERKKQRKAKRREERSKKRAQKKAEKKAPAKKQQGNDQFQQTNTYEYSRSVMAFSRRHEDTCDPPNMKVVRNNEGSAVMFVTQVVRGLVSLRSFNISEPVVYVCGRVSLPNECQDREVSGRIVPFVLLYSDLVLEGDDKVTPLCIDMRKIGSMARYARHSCRPNVQLQHFFSNGKIHLIAVATEKVERGDEITFPFDADYAQSSKPLVCACCAQLEEDESLYPTTPNQDVYVCPIKMFNHQLMLLHQQAATPQPEISTKVANRKMWTIGGDGNKNKAAGVSMAKALQKKAMQRVRKAKGMQGTYRRGRPRTMRTGVDELAKGTVDTDQANNMQVESDKPQQNASTTSTDEEGVLTRKSTSASSITKKALAKSNSRGSSKNTVSVTAGRRGRGGTIKLKRRVRKAPMSALDAVEGNEREAETDEHGTGREIPKQEAELMSDTESTSRKRTRSITTATTQSLAELSHPSNFHVKEEEETKATKVVDEKGEDSDKEPTSVRVTRGMAQKEQGEKTEESSGMKMEDEACERDEESIGNSEGTRRSREVLSKAAQAKRKSVSDTETSGAKGDEKRPSRRSHESMVVQEMNYMLPEDRNKSMTREERKLQQQIALMERIQAQEKRKEDRRHHDDATEQQPISPSSTAALKLETGTETKRSATARKRCTSRTSVGSGSWSAVETKRNRRGSAAGRARSASGSNKQPQHDTVHWVKEEGELSSEESAKGGDEMVTVTEVAVSGFTSKISPPPRKRWASTAAMNVAQNNPSGQTDVGVIPGAATPSTPSPGSGKKAWLLQRAQQQTNEANAKIAQDEPPRPNGTASPGGKKRRNAEKKDVDGKGRETRGGKLTHQDAAVLLTQMASDGVPTGPTVLIPADGSSPNLQRPIVSPSGEMFDIRAQIGKIAAAHVAGGESEFSLDSLVSSTLPAVASTSTAISQPPTSPQPVIQATTPNLRPPKKKMSLDEYRKRHATSHDKTEEHQTLDTAAVTGGKEKSQKRTTVQHSFIPTVHPSDMTRRSSLRLGVLPDPAQLKNVPTASLDDLKERIYGKRASFSSSSTQAPISPSSNAVAVAVFPRKTATDNDANDGRVPTATSAAGAGPPSSKTVTLEARQGRLSLEERMRLVLGCGEGDEEPSKSVRDVQPPPPPPPHVIDSPMNRRLRPPVHPARGRTPPPPRSTTALASTNRSRR